MYATDSMYALLLKTTFLKSSAVLLIILFTLFISFTAFLWKPSTMLIVHQGSFPKIGYLYRTNTTKYKMQYCRLIYPQYWIVTFNYHS